MNPDLREYSAARLGQVWTADDHQFLLTSLARIDRTCIEVWALIRRETGDDPKRLDELLSLRPAPPRGNPDALDLPFGESDDAPDD